MSTMIKMLDKFPTKFEPAQAQEIFSMVLGSLPFTGDQSENQTILKFVFNLITAGRTEEVRPYFDKIILTCLKVMTDNKPDSSSEKNKILVATFMKNVVMPQAEHLAKLQEYEGQMSTHEKELIQKYMTKVQ